MASLFDRLQARRLHPRPLFRRRPPLRHLPACVLAGALWALALSATATEPIPGHSLESIRAWVLEHNPELRAMDFEAQAAEARIQPAGALPDPTASVGFRGLDPDKPWRNAGAEREIRTQLVLDALVEAHELSVSEAELVDWRAENDSKLPIIAFMAGWNTLHPIWLVIDSIFNPLLFRINRILYRGRAVQYRQGLFTGLVALILLRMAGGALVGILNRLLISLPF